MDSIRNSDLPEKARILYARIRREQKPAQFVAAQTVRLNDIKKLSKER